MGRLCPFSDGKSPFITTALAFPRDRSNVIEPISATVNALNALNALFTPSSSGFSDISEIPLSGAHRYIDIGITAKKWKELSMPFAIS